MDIGIIVISFIATIMLLWNIRLIFKNEKMKEAINQMEEINEHNKNVFIRLLKDFGLELNENGEVKRKNDKR